MEKITGEEQAEYVKEIERVANAGPFYPDWSSLFQSEIPTWFEQGKFGIFLHWGLYSVAAHANEWYSRNMYIKEKEEWEYHRKTFGPQDQFGYKDFIPLFQAENFDPAKWAEIFLDAGAKYVFPVAEHHDGFQMYQSRLSRYNAFDMGPKRDIIGELKQELEKRKLTFCTSSHRAEHWFFMSHGREFESDIKEPMQRGDFYWPSMPEPDPEDLRSEPYPSAEYLEDWLLRTCEIIDRYQPALLYFDWWIQHEAFKENLKKLAAYYYNRGQEWGKKVSICYKHDAMMFGSGIVEVERGQFQEAKPYKWQTDTAIAKNSWCYTDTLEYKNSRQIIQSLISVVSKNGNMLLNIGPKADGTIPKKDQEILREIGQWMRINGEGIYGSRPWRKCKEGPTKEPEGQFTDNLEIPYTSEDMYFTVKGDSIYVFVMKYPEDGRILVRSLAESKDQNIPEFHGLIQEVSLLGCKKRLDVQTDTEGMHVVLPKEQGQNNRAQMPCVLRVQMQ